MIQERGVLMKYCPDCNFRWIYPSSVRCAFCARRHFLKESGQEAQMIERGEEVLKMLDVPENTWTIVADKLEISTARLGVIVKKARERRKEFGYERQ